MSAPCFVYSAVMVGVILGIFLKGLLVVGYSEWRDRKSLRDNAGSDRRNQGGTEDAAVTADLTAKLRNGVWTVG